MEKTPLVSIITPCYNGEKYLPMYFQGILTQEHKNIEVIFVDDGSEDNTAAIAKKYGEKLERKGIKFIYIYQENAGVAAAINKGLNVFSGDYLSWLDSDDIILPTNISQKVRALENNNAYGFAMSGILFVDEHDTNHIIKTRSRKKPTGEDTLFEDYIYCRNIVWGPGTVLVRREAVLKAIPTKQIYESKEGQNWQLMLPLSYLFKCYYIDEMLLKCVQHSDSHSRKERSIEEKIAREEGFIILCTETIKKIPGMTYEEQLKWRKKIESFHYRNIMDMSIGKYKYFSEAKKKLKEIHEDHAVKDLYLVGIVKNIYHSVRNR